MTRNFVPDFSVNWSLYMDYALNKNIPYLRGCLFLDFFLPGAFLGGGIMEPVSIFFILSAFSILVSISLSMWFLLALEE